MDDLAQVSALAAINTFSEFVLAMLPFLAVFKLGVAHHQRWVVITVLSISVVIVIAGAVRLYLWQYSLSTWDLNWMTIPQWICTTIEVNVALVRFQYFFSSNHCAARMRASFDD
jgi:hypothetical protein